MSEEIKEEVTKEESVKTKKEEKKPKKKRIRRWVVFILGLLLGIVVGIIGIGITGIQWLRTNVSEFAQYQITDIQGIADKGQSLISEYNAAKENLAGLEAQVGSLPEVTDETTSITYGGQTWYTQDYVDSIIEDEVSKVEEEYQTLLEEAEKDASSDSASTDDKEE